MANVSVALRSASLLGQLLGINNLRACHIRVTPGAGAVVGGGLRSHCESYCCATVHDAHVTGWEDLSAHSRLSVAHRRWPGGGRCQTGRLARRSCVAETFEWVRNVVESLGWSFEVASEQPRVRMENVRFLAGYRRRALINDSALSHLRTRNLDGASVGEVIHATQGAEPLVRAALLHCCGPRNCSPTCRKSCLRHRFCWIPSSS